MGATRAQVLLILQSLPLVCDVQRKILRMIFPTYAETHKLVKGLACHPEDWLDLIKMLTVFAHSEIPRGVLQLSPEDLLFVKHCCRHLHFDCLSSGESGFRAKFEEPETKSILQHPGNWHVKCPRTLWLAKSANWSMRTEMPAYSSAYCLRKF